MSKSSRPTLIIDGLNVFYRHWAANPTMDSNGEHVGGIVGFIKSLQLLCERYTPNDMMVVWEGGGSNRRRAIDSNYKKGKRPAKLNRFYEDIPDTTQNRNSQVAQLVALLRKAGVKQLYVPDCEADDIIAYMVSAHFTPSQKNCVIISTDKDFYQLVNSYTRVWSPGSKKQWDTSSITESFGIHPENFCLARCFIGDPSDGLKGAPGVGFKSLAKRFPALSNSDNLTIDDIVTECTKLQEQSKLKLYDSIIEHEDQIRKNWKLMYLGFGKLSASQVGKINHAFEQDTTRDKLGFIRYLMSLQITNVDYDKLFMSLRTLAQKEEI